MRTGKWWMLLIRVAAFISSPVLWWISYNFSVNGFAYLLPEWRWVGQVFGVVFTILELMFNRGVSKHPTLYFAGIFAYVYSISTNFIGLFMASDLSTLPIVIMGFAGLVLGVCAFGLDILPESMIVWSLYPDEPIITGDFITSLRNGIRLNGHTQKNRPESPVDIPLSNGQDARQNVHVDAPRQSDGWTNSKTARMVRGYLHAHPGASVRQVADGIRQPPSSIGVIMKKMRERGEIRN